MTNDTNTARTDEERPDTRVGTPRQTYAGERRWRDSCFIYVIGSRGHKAVKVGVARDPDKRLCVLQIGNPELLHIFHCFETINYDRAREIEALVHKDLKNRHVLGEWFDVSAGAAADTITRLGKRGPFPGIYKDAVSPGYPEPAAGQIPLVSPLVKNEGAGA